MAVTDTHSRWLFDAVHGDGDIEVIRRCGEFILQALIGAGVPDRIGAERVERTAARAT